MSVQPSKPPAGRKRPTPHAGPNRPGFHKEELERIAWAAIQAVCHVEGWCDEHPSMTFTSDMEWAYPTRKYRAEFRRRLREMGFYVLTRAGKDGQK